MGPRLNYFLTSKFLHLKSHLSNMTTFMFFPVVPSIKCILAILASVRPNGMRKGAKVYACKLCISPRQTEYNSWQHLSRQVHAFRLCEVGCGS